MPRIELIVDGRTVYDSGPASNPAPNPTPEPAEENPFIAWRAAGNTIPQYIMLRNGGVALSPSQEAQARAAGYGSETAPSGNAGPLPSSPYDVTDGAVRRYVVSPGQSVTVTFNRPGTVRVFGASGTELKSVTDLHGTRSHLGSTAWYDRTFALPGAYTFSVDAVGHDVAVQFIP